MVYKIREKQRRTYVPALQRMSVRELEARNAKVTQFGFAPLVNFEYVTLIREDRRSLAKYIASMIVRVPAYRDRVSETFQQYAEIMARIGQPIDNSPNADKNHQIGVMLKTLPTFAKALVGWSWCFIKAAPGEKFIFPDNPVALNMPNSLVGGVSDFAFPILPDLILTAINGPKNLVQEGNHVFQANSEGTRTFNRNFIGKAEKQVFMSDKPEDAFRSWMLENFGKPGPRDIVVETVGKTVRVSKKL